MQVVPFGPDPVHAGPPGKGLKFDGDLHTGTIVNHRSEGEWTVSFRPSPAGENAVRYVNPSTVVRAILARSHQGEHPAPGRYHVQGATRVGTAHIVVRQDGTGTYVNRRGESRDLSRVQLARQYADGMDHPVEPATT